MKITLATWLLFGLASTATACELTGIKGAISDDGNSITDRQVILLKDQARTYGGYQKAADYLEQNRLAVLLSGSFSQDVKDRVDRDMTKNVADLQCWVAACARDSAHPACQF